MRSIGLGLLLISMVVVTEMQPAGNMSSIEVGIVSAVLLAIFSFGVGLMVSGAKALRDDDL